MGPDFFLEDLQDEAGLMISRNGDWRGIPTAVCVLDKHKEQTVTTMERTLLPSNMKMKASDWITVFVLTLGTSTQTATCQTSKYLLKYHPLSSQPWLHF